MKLFNDILKNEFNKYSRKNVTWIVGLVLFIASMIKGLVYDIWIPEGIMWAVLSLILGLGTLSVIDKKKDKKENDDSL